jgi:phosphoglycerol transferase
MHHFGFQVLWPFLSVQIRRLDMFKGPPEQIFDGIAALGTALVCVLIAYLALGYAGVPINIPSAYTGDGLSAGMLFKGVLETGWYLDNPAAGAPFGLTWAPYPMVEDSHFALIWAISLFTDNYSTALTCFYLLSFATASLSAYIALRIVGLGRIFSSCGALLFSLQAYHFLRGAHIFLGSYYSVPVFIGLAFLLFRCERFQFGPLKLFWIGLALVVASSSGVYYAFFGCLFIGLAALSSGLERMNFRPLLLGFAMILTIAGSVFANLIPNISYSGNHSSASNISARNPNDSEILGLKLTQLLLPSPVHRQPALKSLTTNYNSTAPLVNENMTSSLGFVASFGLIVSLGALLLRIRGGRDVRLRQLGTLNVVALLYATVGGFGVLVAWFVTPQIRGLNRVSIAIAFVSIAALLLGLQLCLERIRAPKFRVLAAAVAGVFLAVFGVWDQTPAWNPNIAEANQTEFRKDAKTGQELMQVLPPGSRVYQLPRIEFPESPPLAREGPYGAAKRYLHTKHIAWSYGAMKGSAADQWIKAVESIPLDSRLNILAASGFNAVMVERLAYADSGTAVESQLQDILGPPRMRCGDETCALYLLESPKPLETAPLLLAEVGEGWSAWETDSNGERFIWSEGNQASRLYLLNPMTTSVHAHLGFSVMSRLSTTLALGTNGQTIQSLDLVPGEAREIACEIELKPGINSAWITSTAPAQRGSSTDSRMLGFQVRRLAIEAR